MRSRRRSSRLVCRQSREDAGTVTAAFLVAAGAAGQGRQALMFLARKAVRLACEGFARAVACDVKPIY
jgi:predicted peroxiredoxin